MNTGKWITLAFVLFATFIGTLVTICVRQDIPLVAKNYYQEELNYQDQISRMANADALPEKPLITLEGKSVRVSYGRFGSVSSGTLRIFRPSDAALDEEFTLEATNSPVQEFRLARATAGLYRARLTWEQDGREYYIERIIVL